MTDRHVAGVSCLWSRPCGGPVINLTGHSAFRVFGMPLVSYAGMLQMKFCAMIKNCDENLLFSAEVIYGPSDSGMNRLMENG